MEHPLGVQPQVGLFGGDADAAAELRRRGLGALAALPDEALLGVLHELAPADLARLATVSRVLWAFANHDELWKGFCLEVGEGGLACKCAAAATAAACACGLQRPTLPPTPPPAAAQELEGRWEFQGSWQDTYLHGTVPGHAPGRRKFGRAAGLQCDLLYTPWL